MKMKNRTAVILSRLPRAENRQRRLTGFAPAIESAYTSAQNQQEFVGTAVALSLAGRVSASSSQPKAHLLEALWQTGP
jgi:hypothetical protein